MAAQGVSRGARIWSRWASFSRGRAPPRHRRSRPSSVHDGRRRPSTRGTIESETGSTEGGRRSQGFDRDPRFGRALVGAGLALVDPIGRIAVAIGGAAVSVLKTILEP